MKPRAAPPVFPLPGHRTMAQVMAQEDRNAIGREANKLAWEGKRAIYEQVIHDYGSPYAVRRSA